MSHKLSRTMQVLIIFAFIFAEVGCAQIGIQQSVGSKSGTATNQSRAGGVSHGSGLSTVPTDFSQLKLAPGFLLSLNVLDDADFAGDFRVDEHGDLTLANSREHFQEVPGETTPEARVQIMGLLLERKILKDPQVELSVVPKPFAVAPCLRRIFRGDQLGMDDAALGREIVAAIKPLVAQPRGGAVGGRRHCARARILCVVNDLDVKMIDRHRDQIIYTAKRMKRLTSSASAGTYPGSSIRGTEVR